MNQKPIVGLVEQVTLSGSVDEEMVTVKCDTGAKRTSVDRGLADRIGLRDPTETVTVRSSNGVEERDVYPLTIYLMGETHRVLASVTDRREMTYDAIVGRDVLNSYLVNCENESESRSFSSD